MSYDEAVNLGRQHCRSRGYRCDLQEAHMTGNGIWKVKFEIEGDRRGYVHLEYDAYTRALLKADERVKDRHDGHDEDDDDGHRGRGKGRKH